MFPWNIDTLQCTNHFYTNDKGLHGVELVSTLKAEAVYSSEALVPIYLTTRKGTELSRVSVNIDGFCVDEWFY
jgi:hypothetical protein